MSRATYKELLLVAKAPKAKLDAFAAGADLVDRTGYQLWELQQKAVKDRLNLARMMLSEAQSAATIAQPAYRTAVSRAYYSMYHSVRAVCFHSHGGDDHEKHDKLPSAIPADFPNRSSWENRLKQARFDRNRADYDPYPRSSRNFEAPAGDLLVAATELLAEARAYLRKNGCNI